MMRLDLLFLFVVTTGASFFNRSEAFSTNNIASGASAPVFTSTIANRRKSRLWHQRRNLHHLLFSTTKTAAATTTSSTLLLHLNDNEKHDEEDAVVGRVDETTTTGIVATQESENESLPFSWLELRRVLAKNFWKYLRDTLVASLVVTEFVVRVPIRDLFRSIPFDPRFSNLAVAVLVDFPLYLICNLSMTAIISRVLSDGSPQKLKVNLVRKIIGNRFRPRRAFIASATIGIQSGISEETLFRGIIQTALTNRIGIRISVLLQALVFGLLHKTSIEVVVKNTAAGVLFGIIFATRRNILNTIVVHALWNTFIIFATHVMDTKSGIDRGASRTIAPRSVTPST